MIHQFIQGTKETTLVLLHGTGGSEQDLIPLAKELSPESNVLTLRGDVLENGMTRFFRRHAEGVLDLEDLKKQTERFLQFLDDAAAEYGIKRDKMIPIGYSNGANLIGSALYRQPAFGASLLFHPMVPDRSLTLPDLSGTNVFISAGERDPICPKAETEELTSTLRNAGADVELFYHTGGHEVRMEEVEAARTWIAAHLD
ncbi:alpha/beta hydrolase [Exiguobacterium aestuarii]|uniref:Alpha/beta hydrolase n=1 Tax=Exiguobacterium aestuarii TaxID=273527 RepID=A0ABW2PHY3_9BACL|nr:MULTISPECIES: alpha/beta hydrolase [Exiguobacterium]MCT4785932.1 alpha/beta hydrolase [Exiguobacterium aestuarii]